MRRYSSQLKLSLVLPAFLLLLAGWFAASQNRALTTPRVVAATPPASNVAYANYGRLPLSFEANQGQAAAPVKFLARGGNGTLALSVTEAALALPTTHVRIKLAGANPQPRLSGVEPLPGRVNYLRGRDPRQWQTDVPTYAKVRYAAVYPGVDWVFYGNQQQLEYDFIVAPNADPRAIRMQFAGVQGVQLNDAGELILQTSGGPVRQMRPYIYQEVAGVRREVAGGYKLQGAQEVGFEVGAYDRSQPLVIDPVLVYSTLLGGSSYEAARAVAVDEGGNVYLTGETGSSDFPVRGVLQNGAVGRAEFTASQVFVTKLNPAGTEVLYSVYMGGSEHDYAYGLAVDAAGQAYVTGQTHSADFPLVNAFQTFRGNGFFQSADSGAHWRHSGALGDIVTLAADPHNPATIWAGTAAGLYKSRDGGSSWQPIGGGLPAQRAVTALLLDPRNPLTLYAGTSSYAYFEMSTVGPDTNALIFKSTDGGATWSRLNLGFTIGRVNALVPDPANSALVYAAVNNGGVLKSSDGGQSWIALNNGLTVSGGQPVIPYARNLVIDSSNPARLFGLVNGGVYRSTNGGMNWTLNLMGTAPDLLVGDPRNPLILYAADAEIARNTLFKTSDGGESWQAIAPALRGESAPFFNCGITALAIDPSNPAVLYAGGEEPPFYRGIYKSTDGGATWNLSRSGLGQARVQALVVDPQTPAKVYAALSINEPPSRAAFVAKLNATGTALLYSTYLCVGEGRGITVDATGAAYVTGQASHGTLAVTAGAAQFNPGGGRPAGEGGQPPTPTPYMYAPGFADAFVAKLDPAGSALVYASYLGGTGNDRGAAVALDVAGNAYITGSTDSTDFPVTPKALQTIGSENRKAWVAKLNPAGSALLYATYLGDYSNGYGIAADVAGQAYVTGNVGYAQQNFPATPGVFQPAFGGGYGDAFVAKLKADGSGLVYGTFLGGREGEAGQAIAVDATGTITVAGHTESTNFPVTSDAAQTTGGGGICGYYSFSPSQPVYTILCRDAFVARLNPAGTQMLYSTYLGGGVSGFVQGLGDESANALALDASGAVYLAGQTSSPEYPTTANAFQTFFHPSERFRNYEAFVTKLSLTGSGANLASVSAADYGGAELAPEAIIAAFGTRLATTARSATQTPLPEMLANTTVNVFDSLGNVRRAPLFFVSPTQVNYQMPAGAALGDATVLITNGDNVLSTGKVRLARVVPGLFTANSNGRGVAAAVAQRITADGVVSYEPVARFDPALNRYVALPIDLGPAGEQIYLALFGTGWRNRSALSAVTATVGGVDVPVTYAGPQLQLTGLDQFNLQLPRTLIGRGEVDVVVTVDGKTANTVRVAIR